MTDFEEYYCSAKKQIEDLEETLQKVQSLPYEQRMDIMDRLKDRCKNINIDIGMAKNEIIMMTAE